MTKWYKYNIVGFLLVEIRQRSGTLNFIIVLASLTIQICEVFRGTDVSQACPCTACCVVCVNDEYTSRQVGKLTICSVSCTSVILRFMILAVLACILVLFLHSFISSWVLDGTEFRVAHTYVDANVLLNPPTQSLHTHTHTHTYAHACMHACMLNHANLCLPQTLRNSTLGV